jgi:fused signal recognition particle receptor
MFDFLKEKISSISSIFSKKEARPVAGEAAAQGTLAVPEPIQEPIIKQDKVAAEERQEKAEVAVEEKQDAPKAPNPAAAMQGTLPVPHGEGEKRKIAPKLGIVDHIRGTLTGKVVLEKAHVEEMLESMEMALLEADVAFEVAEQIKESMRKELEGKEVPKGSLDFFVKDSIRKALLAMMMDAPDLPEQIRASGKKPYVILLFGLNGSGKTTTLAKLARLLKESGLSVIAVAADTFRAASIEQLMHHGEKGGFEIVKAGYGSDPTAVIFDGVKHAQANGVDVVIADTAGRQNVNRNLMKELQKMSRVIKPDLSLFIGESISGNALYDAVREYREAVEINGVILTKLDLDAKGGSVISVSKALGVPIYYITYGQGYGQMEKFSKESMARRLFE